MNQFEHAADVALEIARSPLGLLGITLGGYQAGRRLQERAGGHPLLQPVLIAILVAGVAITLLDVDYDAYFESTQLIAFWLGPATVALAIPLHRQAGKLTGFVVPMLAAVVVGVVVSVVSVVLIARLLGADEVLQRTLAPKSVTSPVSLVLSDQVGGLPGLTVVITIVIGIVGALIGPWLLDLARIRDRRARGLAVGSVAHGIGASRMLREDETEGAFAGLAMGLSALATSLLLPLLAALLW